MIFSLHPEAGVTVVRCCTGRKDSLVQDTYQGAWNLTKAFRDPRFASQFSSVSSTAPPPATTMWGRKRPRTKKPTSSKYLMVASVLDVERKKVGRGEEERSKPFHLVPRAARKIAG